MLNGGNTLPYLTIEAFEINGRDGSALETVTSCPPCRGLIVTVFMGPPDRAGKEKQHDSPRPSLLTPLQEQSGSDIKTPPCKGPYPRQQGLGNQRRRLGPGLLRRL